MKIVILDSKTVTDGDISLNEITSQGDTKVYDLTADSLAAERIADADAVICNKVKITAEVMAKCANLRYIGLLATGYNNVEIKEAVKRNITVCNVPAYSTSAVAQQVFSYILSFCSRTAEYNSFVKNGGWISSETFSCFHIPMTELAGSTIGIIGFGSIGREVAKIANAFGMRILVSSRTVRECSYVEFCPLDKLMSESDFITLHCPLTELTKELITYERLMQCKNTAILINTSRGPVVDEMGLRRALDEKIIAGAAVDVLCTEPMRSDCPLEGADNCIITPHVSWAALQTRKRLITGAAYNLARFLDGSPVNTVKE